MLELVGLTDKAGTRAEKLSGGQAQRLSIACALIHDPEIVFLDEPSAALDPQARRNLWDVLRAINERGKTVVLTTHYMDEAESLCDRVAIMDNGKVLQLGPPAELVRGLDAPVRISVEAGALSDRAARAIDGVDDGHRRQGVHRHRHPPAGAGAGRAGRGRRAGRAAGPRRHPGGRVPGAHRTGVPGMRAFSSLSTAMLKGFYRDKLSLFFAILFPLFFIVIFGTVFASNGAARPKVIEVGAGPVDRQPAGGGQGRAGRGGRTRPGHHPGRRARAGAEG